MAFFLVKKIVLDFIYSLQSKEMPKAEAEKTESRFRDQKVQKRKKGERARRKKREKASDVRETEEKRVAELCASRS